MRWKWKHCVVSTRCWIAAHWFHFTHPLLCTVSFSLLIQPSLLHAKAYNLKMWPSKHQTPWSKEDSSAENYSDCLWHKYLSATPCRQLKWPSVTQMCFPSGELCNLWLSLSYFKVTMCHWTESTTLYQTKAHCWGLAGAARVSGLAGNSRKPEGQKWDLIQWSVLVHLCGFHICHFVLFDSDISVTMKQAAVLGTCTEDIKGYECNRWWTGRN